MTPSAQHLYLVTDYPEVIISNIPPIPFTCGIGLGSGIQSIYHGSILGEGGGDLVLTMLVCVCRKVKDMGPFSASSE